MSTINIDNIIETTLLNANKELAECLRCDVMLLCAPMVQPVDDEVRCCIEKMVESGERKLGVVLETIGGYIEVVERIYSVLRHHYQEVVFIIPNFAYSAGTVLVLSGDEIYMDYYSVLGPIDPQIISGDDYVPGIGYLLKFNELLETVNKDITGEKTRGEMALLLTKFDPAKLFFIEQAKKRSIDLLKEWLPKHKFKDWKETESSGKPVTKAMKQDRAEGIAEVLGNPERWRSHGRGIGIKDLESEEIKLKINCFSGDIKLNNAIRNYYNLTMDYFTKKIGVRSFIHSSYGTRRINV